jgi:hypothetical protein
MRHALGLAVAAGLLALLPTSSARAQAAYGYDSWVYDLPSGAMFWNGTGYSGVYTDRTAATFVDGAVAPFRGVAPYGQPPIGTFGLGNGLVVTNTPGAVVAAPGLQQPVRVLRRPLLRRLRVRR